MSLPETFNEIVQNPRMFGRNLDDNDVHVVLELAGIKIDDDGQTLIYPSTVGTNTPRYQVEESRHARWKGRKR